MIVCGWLIGVATVILIIIVCRIEDECIMRGKR